MHIVINVRNNFFFVSATIHFSLNLLVSISFEDLGNLNMVASTSCIFF